MFERTLIAIPLLIVVLTSIGGCSKNISDRIDVAESDLKSMVAYGVVQPIAGSERFMSKPHFYVTRVAYEGESAKSVLGSFPQTAASLGYEKVIIKNSDRLVVCHKTEKGRMAWIETTNRYPLNVSMGVTISGQEIDREKCENV